MLLNVKLRVTSSWLGAERNAQQIRRFERGSFSNKLKLDLAQWNWALGEAVNALGWKDTLDVTSVRFPVHLDPPSLELYIRRWSQLNRGEQQEKFESIRAGTILSFDVLITSAREPAASASKENTRPPRVEELVRIMSFIGEHIGLSPWGNRMGYGRFEVVEVTNGAG